MFAHTRRLHLYSVLLVLFSWIVLGFWKGFGYCFLTDWHYQVLRKMGERDLPHSYIAYLVRTLSGWLPDALLVDIVTAGCTALALAASIYLNFIRRRRRS